MSPPLTVLFHRPEFSEVAAFYVPWCRLQQVQSAPTVTDPALYLDHRGMWLCMPGYAKPYQPSDADLQRRAGRGRGAPTDLVRACGVSVRGCRVLDACAGFGSDGLLLAQLGAVVTAVERQRLVWIMLHARTLSLPNISSHCSDAKDILRNLERFPDPWDVVLLDPMFPPNRKRALPNRGLQHLRELTKIQEDEPADLQELVDAARQRCSGRVVLKRRLKDGVMGRVDYQIKGKSVRFDVYLGHAIAD